MSKPTKTPSGIIEQLLPLAVPISTLKQDPKNARMHGERNLEAIKGSLRRFGQRKPIVVQRAGMTVRAGNGTLSAAKDLGWTEIAAVIVDDDDLTATAFGIADNRTAELAEWGWGDLADAMRELDGQVDLTELGWEQHEIDNLTQADWAPPPDPEEKDPDAEKKEKLEVKFTARQWTRLVEIVGNPTNGKTIIAALERLEELERDPA